MNDLDGLIRDEFAVTDDTWLQSLITEMQDEGFIVVNEKVIRLAS